MICWRIAEARHARDTLAGTGARLHGGRWNTKGVPVVYASTSLALAALERFVHAEEQTRYVSLRAVAIELPDPVDGVRPDPLPRDWRSDAPPMSTMAWGRAWCESAALAAFVPSVLLPLESFAVHGEHNVLLNPASRHATRLRVVGEQPFDFDSRAWKNVGRPV